MVWFLLPGLLFVLALGITLLPSVARNTGDRMRARREFRQCFGFWPGWFNATRRRQQVLVDEMLVCLAGSYRSADLDQRQAHLRPLPLGPDEWAQQFLVVNAKLREAQSAFWEAHSWAKEVGFAVRERYGDYLK